ncbi:MAG: PAS domain-containing protein [Pseudomonadota bacterium]
MRQDHAPNVVQLGTRSMNTMTDRFPAISQVDAYWEGLREGRLMPERAEVDPRGMDGALEYAMLMEMVAPGVARIRVSGLHMSDLLGMEVRGMPLTAFFEPDDRARLQQVLRDVVTVPHVVEIDITSGTGIGRPALHGRLYLAPLAAERDGRPRILACLQSAGNIGRTPRRFTVDRVHKRRIVAVADKPVAPRATAPLRDFAEEPLPFTQRDEAAKPSERPYLRLVKSDD